MYNNITSIYDGKITKALICFSNSISGKVEASTVYQYLVEHTPPFYSIYYDGDITLTIIFSKRVTSEVVGNIISKLIRGLSIINSGLDNLYDLM